MADDKQKDAAQEEQKEEKNLSAGAPRDEARDRQGKEETKAPEAEKPAEEKKEAPKAKELKKEKAPKKEAKEEKDSKDVEVSAKFKSLVEEIEKMSVLDLAELVKILEDKFGVSAAPPMAVAAAPAAGGEAVAPAEEKSEFTVELTGAGDNKIAVIKAVKEVSGLGLADAKALVDGAPKPIKENVKKEEAEEMKKKIEEAGGTVELK